MIFNLIQSINIGVTTEYNPFILYLLSFLAITFAILVIVSKNPIVSVLFLITLFFTVAIFLIIIGLSFIGISYILVYVGAVSILFLFILMLINIRVSELSSDSENSLLLLLIVGLFFITTISPLIPDYVNNFNNTVLYVNYNSWDSKISGTTNILSLGNVMYTNYSILFILTSIILLLAMVGAIVITIKPKDYNIYTYKNYNLTALESKFGFHSFIKNLTLSSLITIILSATVVSLFKLFFSVLGYHIDIVPTDIYNIFGTACSTAFFRNSFHGAIKDLFIDYNIKDYNIKDAREFYFKEKFTGVDNNTDFTYTPPKVKDANYMDNSSNNPSN